MAEIIKSTSRGLETPGEKDTLREVVVKLARRKGIDLPTGVWVSFNNSVSIALLWPLLIRQEKLIALANIQAWIRSTAGNSPHLAEELCQLVYFISTTMAMAEKDLKELKDHTLMEWLEPLVGIAENKILYCLAKKKGVTGKLSELAAADAPSTKLERRIRKFSDDDGNPTDHKGKFAKRQQGRFGKRRIGSTRY